VRDHSASFLLGNVIDRFLKLMYFASLGIIRLGNIFCYVVGPEAVSVFAFRYKS
jgi:hypothetical protein